MNSSGIWAALAADTEAAVGRPAARRRLTRLNGEVDLMRWGRGVTLANQAGGWGEGVVGRGGWLQGAGGGRAKGRNNVGSD